MTNFPLITLTNLPTNLDKLVDDERKEDVENCYDAHPVSFWEYAKALLELEQEGIIGRNIGNKKSGWAYNRALAFLFFHSEPITSDQVAADLASGCNDGTYKDMGGANLRLGEFGGALRERLGHTSKKPYDKNPPYDVNLCSFIAFVARTNIPVGVLFILRHRFRAALAQCFGREELEKWLTTPRPI